MLAELISLKEAAEALGVSVHTLRQWRYQRKIPVVKLGTRVLLRKDDVQRIIRMNLIEATYYGNQDSQPSAR